MPPPKRQIKLRHGLVLDANPNRNSSTKFQSFEKSLHELETAIGDHMTMVKLRAMLPSWVSPSRLDDHQVIHHIATMVTDGSATLVRRSRDEIVRQWRTFNTKGLRDAQAAAMKDPNFQPGAKGHPSHCSEATFQIATKMGVKTSALGPPSGKNYSANEQAKHLETAAKKEGSGVKTVPDLAAAYDLANEGKLVVYAWDSGDSESGHTVTGAPDPDGKYSKNNPPVAQIGGKVPGNGNMPFRNAFGKDKRDDVDMYVLE